MRLFNKTIDRQLFKQYSLGSDLSKQEVVVKIFNPSGAQSWFILNSDPQDADYLWAIVDLGYGAEVGSVSRNDLETYRGRFGLGFERDLGFDPINAEELYNGLRKGKRYAGGGLITEDKLKEEEWFSPDMKIMYQYKNGRLGVTFFYGKDRRYSKIATINNASELSIKELNSRVKEEIVELKQFAKEMLENNFADGGGVGSYSNVIKSKVVTTIGIDRAIEFYDSKYPIRPSQLLENAVRSNFITINEINENVIDCALETAEDSEGFDEIGSSDFTAFLKEFLEEAGFDVHYVNGRLTRVFANGGNIQENKPYIFFFYDKNGNQQTFKTLEEATKEAKQQGQQKVRDNLGEEYFVQYADGGGVESKDTWQNIFEEFEFKKGRSMYGLDMYYKKGYIGSVDQELRNVELMFEDDAIYRGFSIQGLLSALENQFGKRNFADGGEIEVVYERRADFKKKPIKLLLLNKGREQKGYTFSGKDQVAVLDNYNRNKQEDLEKLWNLKGYETKYADGGSLSNYDVVIDGDWDEPKKFKTFSLAKKWIYENAKNYESLELVDPYGDTIFVEGNSTKEDLDWLFSNDEVSAFAKGGNIADFTDNQQMIMNQNVELEHHHEELEDILKDEMPVPAWVVAKMATATQSISDVTHYLDGEKELMEYEMEDEDEEDDEEDEDQDEIENKEVVEPINVSAGTKAELTKKFTDDAMGNLKGFLKGMEGVDLRDDYTFDYKDEQYEVEPIINSDENGVSNAVFSIFDGDGEEVGDVSYSRDGGKQKFTANSEFFSWNNAKFEDGGFMNGVYADGGEISLWKAEPKNKPEKFKTFKSLQAYKSYMTKNAKFFRDEHSKNGTGFYGFESDVTQKEVESSIKNLYNSNNQYADGGYFDGTIPKVSTYMSNYAKGGEVAKAEIIRLGKNILGTTDIEMKITGMRKPQKFSVYPIGADDAGSVITIQSETRIGQINLVKGVGVMSQSHSNGAYFVHFQMDKLTPFTINEKDLKDIRTQIYKTAGDNVGSRGIVSDNSGASRLFADGGFMNDVYADGGDVTTENYEKRLQYLKMMKNNERTDLGKYKIDKEIREINTILEHRVNLKNSFEKGGFMNNVYAKGGGLKDKLTKLENKKSDLESKLFDAKLKANAVMNNIGFGAGMRRSKVNVSSTREDSLKERIKFVEEEIEQTKQDMLPKKPKYILKADIKTVTVKRNGKEVTYKGADVLNGANVLAKGGDISSKANYIPKRDVVEVELNDESKVKPANGYWVKKGAEPIGEELTPITSRKSEPKISETEIRKDMRGNWRAETTVDDFNGFDWRISTVKTYTGNLVSSAQGGKTELTGTKGIVMFKYAFYEDPNHTLEVSKPKRLTDKVVTEQHAKAMSKFKKFMETGMFRVGGKISKFDQLSDKVAKEYEGKPVKSQYQEEYGKYYSKEEAQEVGDKVAGKVKAMQPAKKAMGGSTEFKKSNSGTETLKKANELAKQIRKDGESWLDAKKRAFAQLKK